MVLGRARGGSWGPLWGVRLCDRERRGERQSCGVVEGWGPGVAGEVQWDGDGRGQAWEGDR